MVDINYSLSYDHVLSEHGSTWIAFITWVRVVSESKPLACEFPSQTNESF